MAELTNLRYGEKEKSAFFRRFKEGSTYQAQGVEPQWRCGNEARGDDCWNRDDQTVVWSFLCIAE